MYNYGSEKILCRRQRKAKPQKICKPCPNCKGYFSIHVLRRHYRSCSGTQKGTRNITILSRQLEGNISKEAGAILKNEVFPVLKDDAVVNTIRYDKLLIKYGNKLCLKYRDKHLHNMIRAKLRVLGRFIIEIKKLNALIKELADVFQPEHFDDIIKAINVIGKLDEGTGRYKSPSTAFAIGTALKQTARVLITECIKTKDINTKKNTEDVLLLMESDFEMSVNRTVAESQLEQKRRKIVVLPTTADIRCFSSFLTKNLRKSYNQLQTDGYSFQTWKNLASFTLLSIQVFNRRRAGEIERAKIDDFRTCMGVDDMKVKDEDLLTSLPLHMKKTTKQYVRFSIRGKLSREVAVLLSRELEASINLILRLRKSAEVSDQNPFVFGLPGSDQKHLKATELIRTYSVACGARDPNLLRGTLLRKHIATHSAIKNLEDQQITDLAKFMGHERKIHNDHYRLPIATRDIIQMSQLLEEAQGKSDY